MRKLRRESATFEEVNLDQELQQATAKLVRAYVRFNAVPASDLPKLIRSVHFALAEIREGRESALSGNQPAVPISESIQREYLICLEDGKKLKMLKRYLRRKHRMSPQEYRVKWGLPADYPMVAPEYATRRSSIARASGLGRKKLRRRK